MWGRTFWLIDLPAFSSTKEELVVYSRVARCGLSYGLFGKLLAVLCNVFFFKSIAPFYYPCFTFRQALYGFFFRLELYSSWQPWSRIQTAWGGDYAAMQRRQHRREVRKQGFFFIGTNSGAESICIYRPAPLVVLCDKCTHTHTQEEPGLVREEWMEDAARKHNCNLCLSSFSFLPPSSFENEDR